MYQFLLGFLDFLLVDDLGSVWWLRKIEGWIRYDKESKGLFVVNFLSLYGKNKAKLCVCCVEQSVSFLSDEVYLKKKINALMSFAFSFW